LLKVAVKDACLLIDLELMGIMDLWVHLGVETLTTSDVVDELRDQHPGILAYIEAGNIEVVQYDTRVIYPRYAELTAYGLSLPDVSVLHLAEERNAQLLTCDGPLRQFAKGRRIECHGSIWVLDQLFIAGLLQGGIAAAKLEYLMSLEGEEARFIAPRLAEPYLRKWRKQT